MADRFKVDVSALHVASAGVTDQEVTLSTNHGQVVTNVTSAQTGWIGTSSQALADLTSRWETTTVRQARTISAHADDMGISAQLFGYMEAQHARKLRAVYGDQPEEV